MIDVRIPLTAAGVGHQRRDVIVITSVGRHRPVGAASSQLQVASLILERGMNWRTLHATRRFTVSSFRIATHYFVDGAAFRRQ
jgi:hypothetical protein